MFFVFNKLGICVTHFLNETDAHKAANLSNGYYTTKFSASSPEYSRIEAYERELYAKSDAGVTPMVVVPADPHHDAKRIYAEYNAKTEALAPHQTYCRMVAKATSGNGMTPVEPLATLGTGGGPLLCDYCGKPMILEGGQFNNVPADKAWKARPIPGWRSYIAGGMVVETATNQTLRIYHGHTHGNPAECATKATAESDKAMSEWSNKELIRWCAAVTRYVRDEFAGSDSDVRIMVNAILNTVFGYDPGIGLNRPC